MYEKWTWSGENEEYIHYIRSKLHSFMKRKRKQEERYRDGGGGREERGCGGKKGKKRDCKIESAQRTTLKRIRTMKWLSACSDMGRDVTNGICVAKKKKKEKGKKKEEKTEREVPNENKFK